MKKVTFQVLSIILLFAVATVEATEQPAKQSAGQPSKKRQRKERRKRKMMATYRKKHRKEALDRSRAREDRIWVHKEAVAYGEHDDLEEAYAQIKRQRAAANRYRLRTPESTADNRERLKWERETAAFYADHDYFERDQAATTIQGKD
jgi:hypothetical protein